MYWYDMLWYDLLWSDIIDLCYIASCYVLLICPLVDQAEMLRYNLDIQDVYIPHQHSDFRCMVRHQCLQTERTAPTTGQLRVFAWNHKHAKHLNVKC